MTATPEPGNRDERPSTLPLLVTGSLGRHAVVCNGCGSLVLNNPNAINAHRDSHGPAAAAAAQPTGGEADDVFRDPTQKGRQLGVIIASLLDTYKPEGVGIWLTSPNRNLGGRPLDLIAAGDGGRVLAEADRLSGGPTR